MLPPDDSSSRPSRRHLLSPPRPHGAGLDRRARRDHRRRLLAGRRVQRRLQHAGVGVEGCERADRGPLRRLLRAGDLRRLEGPGRRAERRREGARRRLPRQGPEDRSHRRPDRRPGLAGRQDRRDHAAADGRGLGHPQGERREADRRRRGEQRRRPPDQARRRSDLRRAGGRQPRGPRLPRRRDRAPDRLRLGRRGRPPAPDRALRPRHLLRRPDRAARERGGRPRLDDRGLRPDRDRRRHRLLAARPDPLPRRPRRREVRPRRGARGGHHRRAQRDPRRHGRRDLRPRPRPHRPALHVRRRHLRLARGARRDARLRHAAARAPLLPRAAGRPPADSVPRPQPGQAGGRRGVARLALEPRRPAPALARRDRGDPDPARSGDPRARHAPRLPRRRQRPAEHHDPPGLRPEHRRLRARQQRPARDRRRPARRVRQGEGRRARSEARAASPRSPSSRPCA